MSICDAASMELFRRVVGMRLEKVMARRYPGYLAYSQVVAALADGLSMRIDLRQESIAPMFEVFVVRATCVDWPDESAEWDRFEFGDFLIAGAFVLRREEWIEKLSKATYQPVGAHGVEQRFGAIGNADDKREAVVVDSGVCLVSACGAELILDADTFPLVLQLRYEVASSPLPQSSRIAVNQYRSPQ